MIKWFIIFILAITVPLTSETNVMVFAGSTREDSYNKKLAKEAEKIATDLGAQTTYIDLSDYPIPFYDGDLEDAEHLPKNAKYLQEVMKDNQVIIIASPNYNSSLSATLKNLLDWLSRTDDGHRSKEVFRKKKFVIMSASPGGSGGAKGLVHLRDILLHLGGDVLPQQVSVAFCERMFDQDGNLIDDTYKQQLYDLVREALK